MHTTSGTEVALFYLFLAAAFGSLLGNIKFRGSSLGVAMVLFVGLAIGASHPEVKIPDVIKLLGLAIFVYSIGLSSGQAFFRSLKSRGAANLILAVLALSTLSVLVGLSAIFFGFDSSGAAGLLAGITSNTPALAGLLDAIQTRGGDDVEAMSNSAVVGYSISYPMGIIGLMIALVLVRRLLRVDYAAEVRALGNEFPSGEPIVNHTIQVDRPEILGMTVRDFKKKYETKVIFGRLRRGQENSLCYLDMAFQAKDLVSITGEVPEVERISALLGHTIEQDLADDRSAFAMRWCIPCF
jgi:putative transport protein